MGNKQITDKNFQKEEKQILNFDVLLIIIEYLGYQKEIIYFTNISKSLRNVIRNQNYWKHLYDQTFVYTPQKLKVKDWFKYFITRKIALNRFKSDESYIKVVPIEECIVWEFKCPIRSDLLERTKDDSVDYCSTCKKNVYITSTKEDLIKNKSLNRCIIWDPTNEIIQKRRALKSIRINDYSYKAMLMSGGI